MNVIVSLRTVICCSYKWRWADFNTRNFRGDSEAFVSTCCSLFYIFSSFFVLISHLVIFLYPSLLPSPFCLTFINNLPSCLDEITNPSSSPPPPLSFHVLSVPFALPFSPIPPSLPLFFSVLSVSIPSFSSLLLSFWVSYQCTHTLPPSSSSIYPSLPLCLFVPPCPLLRSMVGCVSCVWTRPRKPSARP